MKFLRANADLRSKTKLESVGETSRCVVVDRCGIDAIEESQNIFKIFRDNRLGVLRAMRIDVIYRRLYVRHDLYRHYEIKKLCVPISLRSDVYPRNDCTRGGT